MSIEKRIKNLIKREEEYNSLPISEKYKKYDDMVKEKEAIRKDIKDVKSKVDKLEEGNMDFDMDTLVVEDNFLDELQKFITGINKKMNNYDGVSLEEGVKNYENAVEFCRKLEIYKNSKKMDICIE